MEPVGDLKNFTKVYYSLSFVNFVILGFIIF